MTNLRCIKLVRLPKDGYFEGVSTVLKGQLYFLAIVVLVFRKCYVSVSMYIEVYRAEVF